MKLLRILAIAVVAALLATLGYVSHAQTPVALAPWFYQQFQNGSGVPIANGCVFTYMAGTSTPLATYTDSTGSFQNSNPIILDGGGFPPSGIWLTANAYRFVVFSSGGVNCATGTQQRVLDFVLPPPFLGANNAWTGNESHAGTETFNGAVNINGTTTFTGTVNGLPGSGTVTNLNVGNIGPLVTTSVANPTTTPSVTFTLANTPTGSGSIVLATSPALVTPTIGGTTLTNVPDSTWSIYCQAGTAGCTFNGTGIIGATILPLGHTLVRQTISGPANLLTTCSPSPVISFRDETTSTNLNNLTFSNSSSFIDSGALSVAMTGGHEFSFRITTAGSGCVVNNLNVNFTAVYE
jgi:hypothetical protein